VGPISALSPRDLGLTIGLPGQGSSSPNTFPTRSPFFARFIDPDKRFPPDHFVSGDKAALRVDLEHVHVDVESFLAATGEGLALAEAGQPEATERLAAAEAAYSGDFLEEDLYEDWAEPLRQAAQAGDVEAARALATAAESRRDYDAAARFLLRVLERDPYDEPAQVTLVGSLAVSGRHGEARGFYRRYCARMREIGVEPAPYPGAQAA
jgi:DNA-binding SARP family transcriptional activator